MLRRRVMNKIAKEEIPDGFKRLNYLEQPKRYTTSWTWSGMYADEVNQIEVTFQSLNKNVETGICGYWDNGSQFYIFSYGRGVEGKYNTKKYATIERDDLKHTMSISRTECIYDGVVVEQVPPQPQIGIHKELTLFGRYEYDTKKCASYVGRIFNIKGFYNGIIKHNFLPCLNMETNEPCFYDAETQKEFYNEGGSKFSWG